MFALSRKGLHYLAKVYVIILRFVFFLEMFVLYCISLRYVSDVCVTLQRFAFNANTGRNTKNKCVAL